jgi:hypothetical protein
MPHFIRLDQTLHLQVCQMVSDGDWVDFHSLGKFIDGDSRPAEQCLQDLIFRAFHEKEYNSPLLACQYIR